MPSLLFTIPTGTDRRTRNRCSKHRCLFERAEIQRPVNKYEYPQRLIFSPGNLCWGSFTNHNTENYLRHGINIIYNQSEAVPYIPGKREHDYCRRFTDVSSPDFSWGREDVCTQATVVTVYVSMSTMWVERLSGLALLHVYRDISIDTDKIMSRSFVPGNATVWHLNSVRKPNPLALHFRMPLCFVFAIHIEWK